MISVIVCHRNIEHLNRFEISLKKTIGCPYELIVIENYKNQQSIFQAYNEGVRQANYDILCFSHEDVIFHTDSWGLKVQDHLQNKEVGLIGVAGSLSIPYLPAPWWEMIASNSYAMNIIQHRKINQLLSNETLISDTPFVVHHTFNPDQDSSSVQAILMDGVWLCARREMFESIQFDENHYNGFHAYDIDICMQVNQQSYQSRVVFDILIEHYSQGSQNKELFENLICFYSKWNYQITQRPENSKISIKELKRITSCFLGNLTSAGLTEKEIIRLSLPLLYKYKKRYKIITRIILTLIIRKLKMQLFAILKSRRN